MGIEALVPLSNLLLFEWLIAWKGGQFFLLFKYMVLVLGGSYFLVLGFFLEGVLKMS